MSEKEIFETFRTGLHVTYGSGITHYEIARIEQFPHGLLVGIYDEPPSKHIDFIKPENLKLL